MFDFFYWLWNTIPFSQLLGYRINIVGALWLGLTIIFSSFLLKDKKPFHDYNPTINLLLSSSFSFLLAHSIYKILDSFFMLAQVITGNSSMIVGNSVNWSWPIFWLTYLMTLTAILILVWYLIKSFNLKQYFHVNSLTIFASIFILIVWSYQLAYYPYDYAVLTGDERIIVFWNTYPLTFLSYGLFYFSFWKFKPSKPSI